VQEGDGALCPTLQLSQRANVVWQINGQKHQNHALFDRGAKFGPRMYDISTAILKIGGILNFFCGCHGNHFLLEDQKNVEFYFELGSHQQMRQIFIQIET